MQLTPEQLFRLLSDPTRLRCIMLLQSEGSLCVCELTAALDIVQPKVSRHLATLRAAGLVVDERRGQWVHYRLPDNLPVWVQEILKATVHGHDDRTERERLAAMPARPFTIDRQSA
ncbi:arsenate reductase [Halorhodospira halochloris]|uniref:Arsenate reductase n=1 Tax=Halorhodospira halochloris TaxID=1052 RepID=A0A0X8X6X0_HALHR|nr:metalloregulator ArsR/SmtB family transcription factor [Halorhodospira halochloris]MBK1650753.1 transcriptional regulator [Halorhodospira halochloris]MCG5548880.1 metalloregulator ArsR/SmtB family transcription factor [Halorhodospira halochloris]BAU56752.1 arsenate reductase [Halorhodospira halochloris]